MTCDYITSIFIYCFVIFGLYFIDGLNMAHIDHFTFTVFIKIR